MFTFILSGFQLYFSTVILRDLFICISPVLREPVRKERQPLEQDEMQLSVLLPVFLPVITEPIRGARQPPGQNEVQLGPRGSGD